MMDQTIALAALLITLILAGLASTENDQQLPIFREYECQEFDKCISVEYHDGKNKEELLLRKKNGSELVFKGYLMNDVDASVTLLINKDRTKYTLMFTSDHSPDCAIFEWDGVDGPVTCMDRVRMEQDSLNFKKYIPPSQPVSRARASQLHLSPNGYKLRVAVYYDDLFADVLGGDSLDKLNAIVAVADQMLSEKQTLRTKFEINIMDISHAMGYKWETTEWELTESEIKECFKECPTCLDVRNCVKEHCIPPKPTSNPVPVTPPPECQNCFTNDDGMKCTECLKGDPFIRQQECMAEGIKGSPGEAANIAEESTFEANVHIFITGSKQNGPLGVAFHRSNENGYEMGSVCNPSKGERQVLVRYVEELGESDQDPGNGELCHNSEVCTGQVLAHEIGHTLGMYHDFNDTSMTKPPRQDPFDNTKKCYGYMDYHTKTHGWSSCSVSDMNRYLANNCLEPIDGPNPTSSPSSDQYCLEVRPRPSWPGQVPLTPTQLPMSPGPFPPGPFPPGPFPPGPFPPGPFPPGSGSNPGQGPYPGPFPPGSGSNPGQGPYPGPFYPRSGSNPGQGLYPGQFPPGSGSNPGQGPYPGSFPPGSGSNPGQGPYPGQFPPGSGSNPGQGPYPGSFPPGSGSNPGQGPSPGPFPPGSGSNPGQGPYPGPFPPGSGSNPGQGPYPGPFPPGSGSNPGQGPYPGPFPPGSGSNPGQGPYPGQFPPGSGSNPGQGPYPGSFPPGSGSNPGQGPYPGQFPPGSGSNPGQGPYPGSFPPGSGCPQDGSCSQGPYPAPFAGSRPIGPKPMKAWPVGPGAMIFCAGPVGPEPVWPGQQPLWPGQGPMSTDSIVPPH